jgi:predicted DNA-binding mobile mystery protein A
MPKRKFKLLQEQLERKFYPFQQAASVPTPSEGWIHAIRTALQMSLKQLSARLHITPQGVKVMEQREREGAITIKTLREVANALDMQLVYGFVPQDGTLEALINKRALELARQIVLRTSRSMKLEDQENTPERLEKAIKERAEELKSEMPKLLWD